MNPEYHGIYAALVTPYTSDGKVDYSELQKLVDHLIKEGIDGFYVNGSTAEAFLLSDEERNSTIKAVVEANAGRKKVICHVGAISTDLAISYAKTAEKCGADAVSAISPFYYKFSEAEIVQYYQDIMASTELPMFVYNFPNFSGFSLTEEVLEKLNKNRNMVGVKFTSSDMFLLEQMKTLHPELVVWNGFDEMLSAGLIMGADGGIGSTYNCMPKLAHKVYDSFASGNMEETHKYQTKMNQVIKVICKYGVFASVKEMLEMDGFAFHGVRRPFAPMSEEGKKELRHVYEEIIVPNR
ncbi:MAG: N-acetylneuraminate lyase [Blautia sp.]|nr:N-acetylneuraminate lyase [Blautia sp.]